MQQISIDFGKRARRSDPATSHQAAAGASDFGGEHHALILAALVTPGTIYEIAGRSGLDHVAVARRISELRDKMKLVVDSGLTRPSPKGRACTVWAAA